MKPELQRAAEAYLIPHQVSSICTLLDFNMQVEWPEKNRKQGESLAIRLNVTIVTFEFNLKVFLQSHKTLQSSEVFN